MTKRWYGLAASLLPCAAPDGARGGPAADAAFRIVQVDNRADVPPGTVSLAATYGAGEAPVRFLIEFDWASIAAKIAAGAGPQDGLFSKGRIRHVAGAAPRPFLTALAGALGATHVQLSPAKADVLPFDIAFLGGGLSRDPTGGFSGEPSGDWAATKLFLADGAAEVYFNFEMETGEAEFSPKDGSYANTIIEDLSKVLW